MMLLKFKIKKIGGHYHTRVFSSHCAGTTFAKLGDIVLDEKDYSALRNGQYKFILEDDDR